MIPNGFSADFAATGLFKVILLAAVAAASFAPLGIAAAQPPGPQGGLEPVSLAELTFAHDALRERIHRIDRIMGGAGYPADRTIGWSRRPHGFDGKSDDDFVAQWSTATDRLRVGIDPGQAPASTVQIYAEVEPKSVAAEAGPQIWRFNLRGKWRPRAPGWSAMVIISTDRPYTADALGKEEVRVHFRHSDETTLAPPFDGWQAAIPMRDSELPAPRGFQQTWVVAPATELTVEQARTLTASAESFRDEALQLIGAAEMRTLADIQAGRGMQRGTYRQVDSDGTTRFAATDPQDTEALSADEIEQFCDLAEREFERRRSLVKEHYEELHAAMLKAFPLDQYVAGEPR